MRAVIKLEFIAENYHAYKRSATNAHKGTERYGEYLGRDQSRPWVARITGRNGRFGFARTFMQGQIDYSQSNSTGSRGVYLYYALPDGIYEVNGRTSWRGVRRYFIMVEGAEYVEIEKKEVEQWVQQQAVSVG